MYAKGKIKNLNSWCCCPSGECELLLSVCAPPDCSRKFPSLFKSKGGKQEKRETCFNLFLLLEHTVVYVNVLWLFTSLWVACLEDEVGVGESNASDSLARAVVASADVAHVALGLRPDPAVTAHRLYEGWYRNATRNQERGRKKKKQCLSSGDDREHTRHRKPPLCIISY